MRNLYVQVLRHQEQRPRLTLHGVRRSTIEYRSRMQTLHTLRDLSETPQLPLKRVGLQPKRSSCLLYRQRLPKCWGLKIRSQQRGLQRHLCRHLDCQLHLFRRTLCQRLLFFNTLRPRFLRSRVLYEGTLHCCPLRRILLLKVRCRLSLPMSHQLLGGPSHPVTPGIVHLPSVP